MTSRTRSTCPAVAGGSKCWRVDRKPVVNRGQVTFVVRQQIATNQGLAFNPAHRESLLHSCFVAGTLRTPAFQERSRMESLGIVRARRLRPRDDPAHINRPTWYRSQPEPISEAPVHRKVLRALTRKQFVADVFGALDSVSCSSVDGRTKRVGWHAQTLWDGRGLWSIVDHHALRRLRGVPHNCV